MSNQPEEVPEYEVLQKAFFAPDLLAPGTRIRTWAPPGAHLLPLNAAAEAAMEAWYEEEHPDADRFDRRPLKDAQGKPVMWKPHAAYRRRVIPKGEKSVVEVIGLPDPRQAPSMSLAEIMAGTDRKATDQRPPPDHVRPKVIPVEAKGPTSSLTSTPNLDPEISQGDDPSLPTAQVMPPAPSSRKAPSNG